MNSKMDIVKIQEQIEKIRGNGYTVGVFDFGVLPMEKPRFDARVCDELGNEIFCGAGDTEFEAKAAAVAMFDEA